MAVICDKKQEIVSMACMHMSNYAYACIAIRCEQIVMCDCRHVKIAATIQFGVGMCKIQYFEYSFHRTNVIKYPPTLAIEKVTYHKNIAATYKHPAVFDFESGKAQL